MMWIEGVPCSENLKTLNVSATLKNDELVETKKIKIEKILAENREEIESGKLVVYTIDRCHLLVQ
ncbi:hypothetical protein [Microcoleus sp. N3A4]|uniref:hypothetical protein n=1 Tax=Microcoleus sp. N3A4 TaxID=3055379 RepID=UPI002FCEAE85